MGVIERIKQDEFLDFRHKGYQISGGVLHIEGNRWIFGFTCDIKGKATHDDAFGMRSYETVSEDKGKTWSEPVDMTPYEWVEDKNMKQETLSVSRRLITKSGTHLYSGIYYKQGDVKTVNGQQARVYTSLIGRKEAGQSNVTYTAIPAGTYLFEQFMENAIQLPSGRILMCLWGSNPGENWQSGVLISDDDGKTFRYKQLAYCDDKRIRNNPNVPAGYNEQTHFIRGNDHIVVLIRGREGLGRTAVDAPKDTCFTHVESKDGGGTWSQPTYTDLYGTGASYNGLALEDGSLLMAARVPHSKTLHTKRNPDLFGQHYARSDDGGLHWHTEHILQSDPNGVPYGNHYSVGRGEFFTIDAHTFGHHFGYYDHKKEKDNRVLFSRLSINKQLNRLP